MNRKSNILAALMFVVAFFSQLFKELKKRGVSEEMTFNALKSKGDLIPQMAERIADLIAGTKVVLKDFFKKDGPVRFYFWDNFKNWILSKDFRYVPREGKLEHHDLAKPMTDAEILREFHIRPYQSIDDLLSDWYDMLAKQPAGEDGDMLTNGYVNLAYLDLNGRTVAVDVRWRSGDRAWFCGADGLDDDRRNAGDRVFFRRLPNGFLPDALARGVLFT